MLLITDAISIAVNLQQTAVKDARADSVKAVIQVLVRLCEVVSQLCQLSQDGFKVNRVLVIFTCNSDLDILKLHASNRIEHLHTCHYVFDLWISA